MRPRTHHPSSIVHRARTPPTNSHVNSYLHASTLTFILFIPYTCHAASASFTAPYYYLSCYERDHFQFNPIFHYLLSVFLKDHAVCIVCIATCKQCCRADILCQATGSVIIFIHGGLCCMHAQQPSKKDRKT
jgi:hypothetical protein